MSFALGVLSALIAPCLMVIGLLIWDNHWIGSVFALNMCKCILASLMFAVMVYFEIGKEEEEITSISISIKPTTGGTEEETAMTTTFDILMLMVSSTIGIIIGDWTWLEGMRLLGPHKVVVMDSLKPFLAAFVGKVILGEHLLPPAFIGLILTVIGTTLVGLEKDSEESEESENLIYEKEGIIELPSSQAADFIISKESDSLLIGSAAASNVTSAEDGMLKPVSNNKGDNNNKSSSYSERRRSQQQQGTNNRQQLVIGLFWSISNVVLHTAGATITKIYGVNMTTFEINFIRFGFAGIIMLLTCLIMKLRRRIIIIIGARKKPATTTTIIIKENNNENEEEWYDIPTLPSITIWIRIVLGITFVSFLQPALTNYAMFQIALALLLTLESIGPIYSLPLTYLMFQQKNHNNQKNLPNLREILGVVLAIGGIVLLAFWGMTE